MSESKFFSAFARILASSQENVVAPFGRDQENVVAPFGRDRLSVGYNAPHCALLPHGNLLEIRTKSHGSNL